MDNVTFLVCDAGNSTLIIVAATNLFDEDGIYDGGRVAVWLVKAKNRKMERQIIAGTDIDLNINLVLALDEKVDEIINCHYDADMENGLG